jgi:hypothetical protein
MKRMVTAFVAVLLGGFGLILPARASIPSPTGCEAQPTHYTLLTTPLLVQVGAQTGPGAFDRAVVCVGTNGGSTNGIAYQEVGVQGQPDGPGPILACDGSSYTGYGAGGYGSGLGFTGGAGFGTWPQLCNLGDGTYQVTVPLLICVGGACPTNTAETIYKTGAVVGTLTPLGAPCSGCIGGGYQLSSVTVWVDNIPIPLMSVGGAAGVDAGAVRAATAGGSTVCVLGLSCRVVPGSAGVYYDGGAIVTVTALGLPPVNVTVPGGPRCVPLFQISPAPPPC